MHTIHTTLGFIIGSRPYGDAGKILSIFTRDFGLIYATAQGIRLEKSKLRYYIQDYTFGMYSLVGGREYWRLTSANEMERDGEKNMGYGEKSREIIARIALLLRRLLQGEQPHPELFDCIFECAMFLSDSQGSYSVGTIAVSPLSTDEMQTLESLVVARMLQHLGYIGKMPESLGQIIFSKISPESLQELASERAILNQHINKALHESML